MFLLLMSSFYIDWLINITIFFIIMFTCLLLLCYLGDRKTSRFTKQHYKKEPMGVMELLLPVVGTNIHYLQQDKKNTGVRKDSEVCYYHSKKHKQVLNFSRPCVCGSLHHQTTRHLHCPVNPRYDDA